jgi:[protein-PII] uridylyltransferase
VDIVALRNEYKANRQSLIETFSDGGKLQPFIKGLTKNADQALRQMWSASEWPKGCALVAVGGYGRNELFPSSDVDILILVSANSDQLEKVQTQVTQLVSYCWDVGLEIGHAVRNLDECIEEAAKDVTVQTSLLEARWLAGSRAAFNQLNARLQEARDPQQFFQTKRLEMNQRHAKFEDTPYSLEPNLKESPGGLRDLQTVLWVMRAAGLGRKWSDLTKLGWLTAREAKVLHSLEYFMKVSRARLHVIAKRREDRVVFDLQAPLARRFGLKVESDRRASELYMQRYYRTAKQITQANVLLMQTIEESLFPATSIDSSKTNADLVNSQEPLNPQEPLDAQFSVRRGLLDINDNDLFEKDPSAILRAFIRMCENPSLTDMTVRTLQAMWRARSRIDAKFRAAAENRALFMQFMQQPRGITHELRRMNQWSILGRYLPAFRRIVGRMQHDLFHVYTVDQHILMVVRNLRRFAIDEHAHEYPLCSELMGHFDKPWLLYLAALFHDIAKGRGGDHSKLGKVDANRFAKQHGLNSEESGVLVFLVEHHLTMSSVAQKQDLSDPEVIENFAKTVGSMYCLNALYLLTVADIRGTSPKVWNNWKGKLLEELFRKTKRILAGDGLSSEGQVDIHQREARTTLALYSISEKSYQAFWDQADITYFSRNDPQDIAWQTRVLYTHVNTKKAIVRCRLSPHGEGFQVVVYSPDQAELFARICGYFDSQNFSVLDARVYTTKHQYALDSFIVTSSRFADQYRDILQMVEHDLAKLIDLAPPLGQPVRGRASRRSRYFPVTPRVDLRPDERSQRFLLSVFASDRTGLLFSIAKVLAKHQVNLHMARISTLGERVEDSFLIDGPSLANQRQQLAFEEDLLGAISA